MLILKIESEVDLSCPCYHQGVGEGLRPPVLRGQGRERSGGRITASLLAALVMFSFLGACCIDPSSALDFCKKRCILGILSWLEGGKC